MTQYGKPVLYPTSFNVLEGTKITLSQLHIMNMLWKLTQLLEGLVCSDDICENNGYESHILQHSIYTTYVVMLRSKIEIV